MSGNPLTVSSRSTGEGYVSLVDEPTKCQRCKRACFKYLGIAFLLVFLAAVVYQAGKYWWATTGCSPNNLKNYGYSDGVENLLPRHTLLIEQKKIWHDSFAVYPASKDGLQIGGSLGIFYRIWGPLFYTYGYQDVLGNKLVTIRPEFAAIGDAHVFSRCDGLGSSWYESEGVHYLVNMLRGLFGTFVTAEYNIYNGSKTDALAQEVGHAGQTQLIFHRYTNGVEIASALLNNRHYHGKYDQWFVEDSDNSPLPAYVTQSIAALFAFTELDNKRAAAAKLKEAQEQPTTATPSLLLEDAPQLHGNSTEKTKTTETEVKAFNEERIIQRNTSKAESAVQTFARVVDAASDDQVIHT